MSELMYCPDCDITFSHSDGCPSCDNGDCPTWEDAFDESWKVEVPK